MITLLISKKHTLVAFSELSEEQKEKALKNWVNGNDDYLSMSLDDTVRYYEEESPLDTFFCEKVHYELGNGRDDAYFKGSIKDIILYIKENIESVKDCEFKNKVKKWIASDIFEETIQSIMDYYSVSFRIQAYRESACIEFEECDLPPQMMDFFVSLQDCLEQAYRKDCDAILKDLKKQYEYHFTTECVKDYSKNNNVMYCKDTAKEFSIEFLPDGATLQD